ncbi:MAG: hypothetical protein HFH93_07205 [Lachnospiraceae bacterium]|nr:hypothetical protein [Lachnospiraceae bacterium]
MKEDQIRPTIFSDSEFTAYGVKMDEAFLRWKACADQELKTLKPGVSAKKLIERLAQVILEDFENFMLIDKYSVYQMLLLGKLVRIRPYLSAAESSGELLNRS